MPLAQAPRQQLPGPSRARHFLCAIAGTSGLQVAQFCANWVVVKREQFFSDLRRWCRKSGHSFRIDSVAGKGSHVKVYIGGKATIVKAGELSPVYVGIVLKQLGIPKDAI
jgi:hypothetical protein